MNENKALKKHNFKMTTAYKATKGGGGERGQGGAGRGRYMSVCWSYERSRTVHR
jgi:hypothetical protein